MEININRTTLAAAYTMGVLSADGIECATLEPPSARLTARSTGQQVAAAKRHALCAIPTGRYRCVMAPSARFGAPRPRLLGVTGFSGILIHEGNTVSDTRGCLLVGRRQAPGVIGDSRRTLSRLMSRIAQAERAADPVSVIIREMPAAPAPPPRPADATPGPQGPAPAPPADGNPRPAPTESHALRQPPGISGKKLRDSHPSLGEN